MTYHMNSTRAALNSDVGNMLQEVSDDLDACVGFIEKGKVQLDAGEYNRDPYALMNARREFNKALEMLTGHIKAIRLLVRQAAKANAEVSWERSENTQIASWWSWRSRG